MARETGSENEKEEEKEEAKHEMRVVGIDVEENRGESDYFVKSKKEEELLLGVIKEIPIIEEFDPLSREFMGAMRVKAEEVVARSKKLREKFLKDNE